MPNAGYSSCLPGDLRFASREQQGQDATVLLGQGALVVTVDAVDATARGRLAELIDEAIERALASRGAASAGMARSLDTGIDHDGTLNDQLFRARATGAAGLAIAIGPLGGAARPALTPEDSATLRFFAAATATRPLVLMLDDGDLALGAYADPIPLSGLLAPTAEPPAAAPAIAPVPAPVVAPAVAPAAAEDPVPERDRAGAAVTTLDDTWRTWALALNAARGPQPLAAFERLFQESYLPLANAIASGVGDPRAIGAHDEFSRNFAKAYTEAFPTFAVTGKRPKLVMDVAEVASKIARHNGARSIHLVLVDAMRKDVGAWVTRELARLFGQHASLTSEALLWSALPSTTAQQLETIARGPDALRSPAIDARETESLRGRSAEVLRRVRLGPRDVYKLDIVDARLRELGEHPVSELAQIAETAAELIARHASSLPPRTLLVVFGDHGFSLDREGRVHHGGASPEEILVPISTFLMGALH